MGTELQLLTTINDLVKPGKGILAADESLPTIGKRFQALGIPSTEQSRREYRTLLLTTPGVGQFLSGVILFEETLDQRTRDGVSLPELASRHGIVPGIKVDKGTVPLPNTDGDLITQGLDGLADRLREYQERGARFAKWREVYKIGPANPTPLGISANAEVLARYAAICQSVGMVPIVEPEVLIDGEHSMVRCAEVTEQVLQAVFDALHRHRVLLEAMLLKPNMILPGKANPHHAQPELVATETMQVLRRTVPAAVPSINFLSGGQTPAQATANLHALNAMYPNAPWALSFSYARALQEPVMAAWRGKAEQHDVAQRIFYRRAELTALARAGQYDASMEDE
ncbi:MAG: class I fructose-bisphosphate aldolase [Pseudomonadota bacterium]